MELHIDEIFSAIRSIEGGKYMCQSPDYQSGYENAIDNVKSVIKELYKFLEVRKDHENKYR